MNIKSKISKEEINELPRFKFEGKISLITDDKNLPNIVEELLKEKALGFDTETRAAFKKGERYQVSLLQLATKEKAYLFRLNKIKTIAALAKILGNPDIIKAGVAIRDDIKALKRLCEFEPAGFVELADMAKEKNIENFGLRALTAITMGKRLSKKEKISNWEKDQLSEGQIHYAASDAVVGLGIYECLINLEKIEV